MASKLVTNEKQSWEEIDLPFDFSNRNIASGVSVASVTSIDQAVASGSGTLTISGTTFSALKVVARFAGGVAGSKYKLTCKAVMTNGEKYEADGYLTIKEL